MENNDLKKIMDSFLNYCEENNYRGIIAASDKKYENNYAANFADNFDVMLLLRNFLLNFQEKTGSPATPLATHLALSLAIMDINEKSEKPLEEVTPEILEQATTIVQDCMDKELEQTRADVAKG